MRDTVSKQAQSIFDTRARSRLRLSMLTRNLDDVLKCGSLEQFDSTLEAPLAAQDAFVSFLGDRAGHTSFTTSNSFVRDHILIPRYYDPEVESQLSLLDQSCELPSIQELVDQRVVELATGHEIGKLAYGTGDIPFCRTSDLANWELKSDPKHSVSADIYAEYSQRQSVRSNDILIVRDGTYLVGTCALVTEYDLPMLYCGGIYRARVLNEDVLDPFLLLALLNTRIVQRQIRNKQFTRDVIDTLGRRIGEIRLPVPKSRELRRAISNSFRDLLTMRLECRIEADNLGAFIGK